MPTEPDAGSTGAVDLTAGDPDDAGGGATVPLGAAAGGSRFDTGDQAVVYDDRLADEVAGLDALELAADPGRGWLRRGWSLLWPKLAAVGLFILIWELAVLAHWRPKSVLPPPAKVWRALRADWSNGQISTAVQITMWRAARGYLLAVVIGSLAGIAIASSRILRTAFGSLVTGLQTMPSAAWFPLAILLFRGGENAIFFVVVLGAAPSIANGLVGGIDFIPPLYLRAGRVLGAKGVSMYRHVILPAAFPNFIGGLKQGWAFAWRSLMAGELLVIVPGRHSIGELMDNSRAISDAPGLIASMVVIMVVGIVVDAVLFQSLDRRVRKVWGLNAQP
jgi:NitT/TauT family transport system permease protein